MKLVLHVAFAILMVCSCGYGHRPCVAACTAFEWPEGSENATTYSDKSLPDRLAQVERDIAELCSSDAWVSRFAWERLSKIRTTTIDALLKTLKDKHVDESYGGPLHRAISLLGEYRAEEAVSALGDRLSYLPPARNCVPAILPEYETYYPSAKALVSIGQPAVPAMIAKIAGATGSLERSLSVWVVVCVEGKGEAAHRFDEAAKTAASPEARRRLEAAREYAQSYQPRRGSPYRDEPEVSPAKS